MRRFLEQAEHWQRWYAVLADNPGSEASLSTRALFLTQQLVDEGVPQDQAVERVLADMEGAAGIAGDAAPEERPAGRLLHLPWLTAGAGLLAAGFLIGVLLPPEAGLVDHTDTTPEQGWRGEAATDAPGTLRVFIDGVEWRETTLGVGARPRMPSGRVELLWEGGDQLDAWAWTLADPSPVRLDAAPWTLELAPGDVLVVAEGPPTEAPERLPALVGDGQLLPINGFGGVRFLVFQIEPAQ